MKEESDYKLHVYDFMKTIATPDLRLSASDCITHDTKLLDSISDFVGVPSEDISGIIQEGEAHSSDKSSPQFQKYRKVWMPAATHGLGNGSITLPIYDDCPSALERLAESGTRIVIYGNGPKQMFRNGMGSVGLDKHISDYYSTKSVGDKYDPGSYRKLAEREHVSVKEIVFTTDDPREAEAAVEAGIGKVYLIDRKASRPGLHQKGYYVINNLMRGVEDVLRPKREEEASARATTEI